MRVVVYGLWHLGCVTAACLADAGNEVVGLDLDGPLVDGLNAGKPPLDEPGLPELIATGRRTGRLSFSTDAAEALHGAGVLWVTFDTPVDENDVADVAFVRNRGRVRAAFVVDATGRGAAIARRLGARRRQVRRRSRAKAAMARSR